MNVESKDLVLPEVPTHAAPRLYLYWGPGQISVLQVFRKCTPPRSRVGLGLHPLPPPEPHHRSRSLRIAGPSSWGPRRSDSHEDSPQNRIAIEIHGCRHRRLVGIHWRHHPPTWRTARARWSAVGGPVGAGRPVRESGDWWWYRCGLR